MTAITFIALATIPIAIVSWMWFRFVMLAADTDLDTSDDTSWSHLDASCNDL